MASIIKEIRIDARPDEVWDALRDFGEVHRRLAAGFVVDSHLDGNTRTITFFNGAVAREMLVGIDETARRLVYSVIESPLQTTHDNSSAQVLAGTDGCSRFVWIKDVLPDEVVPRLDELMEQGIACIKQTVESQARADLSGPS
jgi:hypothetical protein